MLLNPVYVISRDASSRLHGITRVQIVSPEVYLWIGGKAFAATQRPAWAIRSRSSRYNLERLYKPQKGQLRLFVPKVLCSCARVSKRRVAALSASNSFCFVRHEPGWWGNPSVENQIPRNWLRMKELEEYAHLSLPRLSFKILPRIKPPWGASSRCLKPQKSLLFAAVQKCWKIIHGLCFIFLHFRVKSVSKDKRQIYFSDLYIRRIFAQNLPK